MNNHIYLFLTFLLSQIALLGKRVYQFIEQKYFLHIVKALYLYFKSI